ncbi:CcoQ/FixQ family Cbb3-type cytochrome c oxidase assembly chaperone [Pseudomonas sp. 8Z]|uniref:cbb3-type cytochrome oxidase subunit 3 n=1 Tax=Pseudomonas sp. 8Z TaxID=2653166 RepID=UPI0012F01E22|nr:cbb3-type cytochrome c oxidase subunit 3 [Pseudomonas sp. 8Z]VXC66281.1 CcoQ/FixQ family Cbb3-type cytochrome c oxidase assembly chaperone [Pseudomonas sp. 8Z]
MFEFIDVGTLRGLGTALVLIAFTAVTLWAYSGKRREDFEAAANLPFADDHKPDVTRIQA